MLTKAPSLRAFAHQWCACVLDFSHSLLVFCILQSRIQSKARIEDLTVFLFGEQQKKMLEFPKKRSEILLHGESMTDKKPLTSLTSRLRSWYCRVSVSSSVNRWLNGSCGFLLQPSRVRGSSSIHRQARKNILLQNLKCYQTWTSSQVQPPILNKQSQ